MPSDRDNDEKHGAPIDKVLREPRATSDLLRTHSSPSGDGATLLGSIERLRQRADDFQRTVEEEVRTSRTLIEELQVRRAKRGHGRRVG
jgi:hypothetical protein